MTYASFWGNFDKSIGLAQVNNHVGNVHPLNGREHAVRIGVVQDGKGLLHDLDADLLASVVAAECIEELFEHRDSFVVLVFFRSGETFGIPQHEVGQRLWDGRLLCIAEQHKTTETSQRFEGEC